MTHTQPQPWKCLALLQVRPQTSFIAANPNPFLCRAKKKKTRVAVHITYMLVLYSSGRRACINNLKLEAFILPHVGIFPNSGVKFPPY